MWQLVTLVSPVLQEPCDHLRLSVSLYNIKQVSSPQSKAAGKCEQHRFKIQKDNKRSQMYHFKYNFAMILQGLTYKF